MSDNFCFRRPKSDKRAVTEPSRKKGRTWQILLLSYLRQTQVFQNESIQKQKEDV